MCQDTYTIDMKNLIFGDMKRIPPNLTATQQGAWIWMWAVCSVPAIPHWWVEHMFSHSSFKNVSDCNSWFLTSFMESCSRRQMSWPKFHLFPKQKIVKSSTFIEQRNGPAFILCLNLFAEFNKPLAHKKKYGCYFPFLLRHKIRGGFTCRKEGDTLALWPNTRSPARIDGNLGPKSEPETEIFPMCPTRTWSRKPGSMLRFQERSCMTWICHLHVFWD